MATKPITPPSKSNQLANDQKKALDNLMKERELYAKKHNGSWPSDAQLQAARKSTGLATNPKGKF